MNATAYPLSWPAGWPRQRYRSDAGAKFKRVSFARARDGLGHELELLGAREITLSTNVELRFDGQPRAGGPECLPDPGVAVYFTLKGKPFAMARDEFSRVSDNMRSLALAVAHLRGMHRHGGAAMVERVFTGFAALPEPGRIAPWRELMGFDVGAVMTADEIEARYRVLARQRHPDVGGTDQQMAELNSARERALLELGAEVRA